jgi:hypothetical protein
LNLIGCNVSGKSFTGAPKQSLAMAVLFGAMVALCPFARGDSARDQNRLSAQIVLDARLIEGPFHTVEPAVFNDGSMNRYRIASRFGPLEANSTAELEQFVRELAAIDVLSQLSNGRAFAEQLSSRISDTVTSAVSLLTDTQATLVSAAAGVEKIAERVGDGVADIGDESVATENPLGPAATKRAYAKALGVDPYSSNPLLQSHLERVARAGYAGDLMASASLALVGGPVISAGSMASSLQAIDVSLSPADARRRNQRLLRAMGINVDVARDFVRHPMLTPTQQSLVVHALGRLDGAHDRERFLKGAARVIRPEQGAYYERQAGLYSRYHRSVAPVSRFVPIGEHTGALTRHRDLVMMLPADHLRWTPRNAHLLKDLDEGARRFTQLRTRELWLSGGITLRMARELKNQGWQPVPHAGRRLQSVD